MSPLSPRQPSLSVIPEQTTNNDGGETLNFFEMLASERPAETPSTWPPLDDPSARRKASPRSSTVSCDRRATVQTETSQEPTQNFFNFVQVKARVL